MRNYGNEFGLHLIGRGDLPETVDNKVADDENGRSNAEND